MSRQARGFTLVEVLVAFVITALALGTLYSGAIASVASSHQIARTQEAVARAQSRLAAQCNVATLMPGTQSGDDGSGYSWRTKVQNIGSSVVARGSEEEQRQALKLGLFAVTVTISWGRGAVQGSGHVVMLSSSCLALSGAAPT